MSEKNQKNNYIYHIIKRMEYLAIFNIGIKKKIYTLSNIERKSSHITQHSGVYSSQWLGIRWVSKKVAGLKLQGNLWMLPINCVCFTLYKKFKLAST